jgi:hypothetical protein
VFGSGFGASGQCLDGGEDGVGLVCTLGNGEMFAVSPASCASIRVRRVVRHSFYFSRRAL